MLKRLFLGLVAAILMAPALHAGAATPQALSNMPWEKFTNWAISAICDNLGICLSTTP